MSSSTLGMTLSTDERARILQQAWGTSNSPQQPSKQLQRDLSSGTTLAHQAQQVQNSILDRNRSSQEKRRAAHEYLQQRLTERNVGVDDMGNQDGGAASALASWHCRELAASLLRSESSARKTTPVQGTIDQVSETVLTCDDLDDVATVVHKKGRGLGF
eukprot:COSAG05_NODE_249_length_12903_cov_128.635505_9_plen_159_part_00